MTPNALSNFHYHEQSSGSSKTIFLLHGTGGDEHDLFPLVAPLSEKFNLVGLRGNVSEQGMRRFFVRSNTGVFDQESIRVETKKLAAFIRSWMHEMQLSINDITFVGYSNGANMILALLLSYPEIVTTAVALHPKLPFEPQDLDLHNKKLLISYGEQDQMIPAAETKKAIATLQKLGADVTVVSHPGGHEIRSNELDAVHAFLNSLI